MVVVGLVGPFGSGCTYVGEWIEKNRGYKLLSLSKQLRELYSKDYPRKKITRKALQDYGNSIREKNGSAYLAVLIWEKIQLDMSNNYVIDSIRNPDEINFLRTQIAEFYLFGVFAETESRWNRVKSLYSSDRRAFDEDDHRDSGEKFSYGQRVTDSFRMSDIIILNNNDNYSGSQNDNFFRSELNDRIDLIEKKIHFRPTPMETYMTMAYASSMRSSCLKRKVGATIVDANGNVFSSGYNEVPSSNKSCFSEYGNCYRDRLKNDFKESLDTVLSKPKEIEAVFNKFKGNFKILDYCRALHAEENAILNVARVGASAALTDSTLYTSTYPCNLCANKIAQVGIKKIVYFEPYPMPEAKKILSEQKVTQTPFSGVTYNGYFRLMEVVD
jgi:deoxycytidylate deaminase